jgi:hypothetical protein
VGEAVGEWRHGEWQGVAWVSAIKTLQVHGLRPFSHFLALSAGVCSKRDSLARQDSQPPSSQAPLSDKIVERAPTRGGRTKIDARRPDLRRLLRRTLAALERDLPALRAAELSRTEVAAFLAEQLAALSEAGAPDRVRGGADSGEPRAERLSSDCGAARAAVLNALRQLEQESPPGALLSVRELRARSDLDKPSFDRAALELAGQGRVSLHAHDHVGALEESERRALIEDVRGVHYIGIASIPDARHEVSL